MKTPCQIVICGDLCPTADTETLFMSGNAKRLFNGLLDVFRQADLLIGNAECPLTDIGRGIKKCGPVLKGPRKCLSGLKAAGFDLLGLANNHIRDCGDEGVLSTLACCHTAGILTVGAGKDPIEAKKAAMVELSGWKIGIMAFAEREFNAASGDRAGANVLDVFYSFDEVREVRAQCDCLIVLYHGGIEYYEYPSPLLQKKCRKMVESGADLVLCQHSHCVGTTETYKGGTILYGQGNTVYGYRSHSPSWNTGLIVKVRLEETPEQHATIEYVPISADEAGVDVMPVNQAKLFLEELEKRSQRIMDAEFVIRSWKSYCQSQKAHYLPLLLGLGRVLTYINRKMNNRVVDAMYTRKRMRITCNLIRCEAHHEVVETILEDHIAAD